jgi:hypothetical protein
MCVNVRSLFKWNICDGNMIQPFCIKNILRKFSFIISTAKLRENIYSYETGNLYVVTSWLHFLEIAVPNESLIIIFCVFLCAYLTMMSVSRAVQHQADDL